MTSKFSSYTITFKFTKSLFTSHALPKCLNQTHYLLPSSPGFISSSIIT